MFDLRDEGISSQMNQVKDSLDVANTSGCGNT